MVIVAILPYLPLLGQAVIGLCIICCVCLGVYAGSRLRHQMLMDAALLRRAELHASVIDVAGVVAYALEDGSIRHLSAEHEAAKLLPAPRVTVSEVDQGKPSAGELEVLTLLSRGESQRKVADACGISQTKVSEIKRRWQHQTGMVD